MRNLSSGALLACIVTFSDAGEHVRAATVDPAAAKIIAAMRVAAGGDRWSEVRSLQSMGIVTTEGTTAPTERWEDVATGRYLTRTDWRAGRIEDGFDGISPWHLGRSGIAYTLGDADTALVAADEAFRVSRAWWFLNRHEATIASVGTRADAGRTFDVLSVTPEGGRAFLAWVDSTTHLLARTDERQAKERVVTTYSDYRDVDGLRLPFTIRSGDGVDPTYDEIETVRSIDVDPVVPDNCYGVPPLPPSDIELPTGQDNVEVPFRLTADDRILIPLTIDGRKTIEAEFDSGGSLIVQPAVLAAMGLASSGRAKQSGGGEGATSSAEGRLTTISLGDAQIKKPAFQSYAFAPDEPDRGLVGLEVLQRFVVRFDFDRRVMTLTNPAAFRNEGNGAVIPFHFESNQPEIRGSIDGIAGVFEIDTGAAGSLLLIAPFARRYDLLHRYGADLPYSGTAVAATRGAFARRRTETVSFDGEDGRAAEVVRRPVTRISMQTSGFDADRNVSANIGLGILKRFNLTFNYARQQLTLERNRLYGQEDVANRTGFRLRRLGSVWVVTAVWPGTPAAEAGLKIDDVVSSVDGKGPEQLDPASLAAAMIQPVGTSLRLELGSGTRSRSVILRLREIL